MSVFPAILLQTKWKNPPEYQEEKYLTYLLSKHPNTRAYSSQGVKEFHTILLIITKKAKITL